MRECGVVDGMIEMMRARSSSALSRRRRRAHATTTEIRNTPPEDAGALVFMSL
jgi:hypothetical protein